jgi:hypothetical protein
MVKSAAATVDRDLVGERVRPDEVKVNDVVMLRHRDRELS